MKGTRLLVLLLACLLSLSAIVAQSAAQTETVPSRQVKGQVLTSTQLPPIQIKFKDSFKYIGSQQFILYERAQVEQFFFVNADSEKRIKSMYFVQFEGYLPSIDATYNYPVTETVTLAGQTYIVNAQAVPNVTAALKQNPQSDAARAVAFLENKGYRMNESIRFQRFVRLVDDAKRNEILMIYIEDAGASSSQELGKEFSARALQGFTVEK
jgi:hypothetical protein